MSTYMLMYIIDDILNLRSCSTADFVTTLDSTSENGDVIQ